jgi:hypothetical protein
VAFRCIEFSKTTIVARSASVADSIARPINIHKAFVGGASFRVNRLAKNRIPDLLVIAKNRQHCL